MTTNKPEVVGFVSEAGIKNLRERNYACDWTLYAEPARNSTTPLIRLSDYEALQAANARLHAAIRRLCSLYVVYDHYDAQLREELLDKAVIQAISATMEKHK